MWCVDLATALSPNLAFDLFVKRGGHRRFRYAHAVDTIVPLSSLQRRVDRTVRLYRALLVLLGGLPADDRNELDAEISAIPNLTKTRLLELENRSAQGIKEIDRAVGLLAKKDDYIELVETAMQNPNDLFFIPKEYIRENLFRNYDKAALRWNQYPAHTRIGIDARGTLPFTGKLVEWRLLEAALFEDVASLWNQSLDAEAAAAAHAPVEDARLPRKKFDALKRSTARAVFALLEGYINSIAVNIEWSVDLNTLPAEARELVLERADDGRVRFKKFRDKVMQYPKVATGAAHPPIPENNPQLALILQREREWRDAVMHPTPRLEEGRVLSRERTFFEIDIGELRELIDSAISLIKQVDAVLNGKFGSVDLWIHERGVDARFPNEVFH